MGEYFYKMEPQKWERIVGAMSGCALIKLNSMGYSPEYVAKHYLSYMDDMQKGSAEISKYEDEFICPISVRRKWHFQFIVSFYGNFIIDIKLVNS